MPKKRILAVFDHVTLIVICCHFAIAVSHSDCGQLEQCVTDSQGNVWCSLFNNASTNDMFILGTFHIYENISHASIDSGDVKIYWNTHTQDIFLMVPRYQRATDIDIIALLEGKTLPVHIHVEIYDVRVTGYVLKTGDNKQIVLNCSVTGIHNTSSIVEIRFNDDKSYSCQKTGWPNEPQGSIDRPHVRLLDDTTCQLTIPNATKANFVEYFCRVKLQLLPISSKRDCYLLSETITPSEEALISDNVMVTSKNEISSKHVAAIIAVPVVVVVLVLLSILPAVVVIKAIRYYYNNIKGIQHAQNEQGLREPLQCHINGRRESEERRRNQANMEISDSGSGYGIDPVPVNTNF